MLKMTEMQEAPGSAYVLEISIEPGAARTGMAFVYPRIAPIRRVLEYQFLNDDADFRRGTFEVVAVNEASIVLWLVESGHVARALDLRPWIGVKVGAREFLPLRDSSVSDIVSEVDEGAEVQFSVAWDQIKERLPKLTGEPLERSQRLTLVAFDDSLLATFPKSYLVNRTGLKYGFNDLEFGEASWWIDPEAEVA